MTNGVKNFEIFLLAKYSLYIPLIGMPGQIHVFGKRFYIFTFSIEGFFHQKKHHFQYYYYNFLILILFYGYGHFILLYVYVIIA